MKLMHFVDGKYWGEPFMGDYDILDDGSEVCWCQDNAGRTRELLICDKDGNVPKHVTNLMFSEVSVEF